MWRPKRVNKELIRAKLHSAEVTATAVVPSVDTDVALREKDGEIQRLKLHYLRILEAEYEHQASDRLLAKSRHQRELDEALGTLLAERNSHEADQNMAVATAMMLQAVEVQIAQWEAWAEQFEIEDEAPEASPADYGGNPEGEAEEEGEPSSDGAVPPPPAPPAMVAETTSALVVAQPPGLATDEIGAVIGNAVHLSKAYEKLEVPPLPNPGRIKQWLMAIGESLVRTSGVTSDEVEIEWLHEVYEKTFEELGQLSPDPRLRKADLQLAVQTEKVINKSSETVKYQLELKKAAIRAQENRILKGREMIWMVVDHFKMNASLKVFYTFQDLLEHKWLGDDKLEQYYRGYLNILANTKDKLAEAHLREILLRALKQSKKLSLQIQMWEDLDVDNPRRTHQGLLNIITKRLSDDQMEPNHRRGRPAAQTTAAPAPKGEAKAKPKAKSEGKGSGNGGGNAARGGKGQKGGGKGKSGGPATAGGSGQASKTSFCFNFIGGKCEKGDACTYIHVSEAQKQGLARALSSSPGAKPKTEGGGKGGKSKGKGKSKTKAAPAPADTSATGGTALDGMTKAELKAYASRLESAPTYCGNYAKGKCTNGDKCKFPHHEGYSVDAIKHAAAVRKEAAKTVKAAPAPTQ